VDPIPTTIHPPVALAHLILNPKTVSLDWLVVDALTNTADIQTGTQNTAPWQVATPIPYHQTVKESQ